MAIPQTACTPEKIFLAVMLPLVLRENERILENRERLNTLLVDDQRSPRDNRWLRVRTVDYGVKPDDWTALLDRMDAVPPALGLAQAAIESGWGGSRFAAEGNALFGQWTQVSGQGIVPERRAATSRHEVRKFRNIGASVTAYLRNLNTHMAYTDFRSLRSKIRSEGGAITGQEAAGTLIHYAETGSDYVVLLSEVMVTNELGRFDPAKLTPQKGAFKWKGIQSR
ncbi:MAG TPA: hypothetical protein EYQ81_01510 [Sneathiellales bacterium]|nr:hypothetical protein [Sneathiellales bacterium]